MQLVSLNDKGQVCERIYIKACLDQIQNYRLKNFQSSRFPGGRCYYKHKDDLKVRVRAQFLCPQIIYSVNLVFRNAERKRCQTLHYILNGEEKCCMVYDTYKREDGWFVVSLYQFTSDRKTADFEIDFRGFLNGCKLQVAGFEFQPLEEKAELHDQGLEEYEDIVKAASQSLFYKSPEEFKELLTLHTFLQWTMKKGLFSDLLKKSKGQKGYAVDNNGKKSLMFSARGVITRDNLSFQSLPESRFGEVAVITDSNFKIVKKIKCDALTPETTYACYLVYKSTEDQPVLKITHPDNRYIYLRSDGWMEVKVWEIRTSRSAKTIHMDIWLSDPYFTCIRGLIIESIELRPTVAHSA
ncbi:protein kinase-like domain, Phloem protein 2-like protein [Artemisia annua]|uniref:Protein kinase-like domain, Phloem protein 2-like protein n=1 Tax=Artemisia annua TaxID=35608 RepID=A0A2U1N4A5_ARTAN|nr:protein kinase-like domain, Phloem protein 2-like protein [Artemisia annua]